MISSLTQEDCKNPLAIKYQQSQLYQNMIEELDHVNQSIVDGVTGEDKPANYATSFFYQVSKSSVAENIF